MNWEDIKLYLPKYLSSDSESELFAGLKDFPNNLDTNFYSNYQADNDLILQGDGIRDMLVVNLPKDEIKPIWS